MHKDKLNVHRLFPVEAFCGLKHDRPESVPSYVSTKHARAGEFKQVHRIILEQVVSLHMSQIKRTYRTNHWIVC